MPRPGSMPGRHFSSPSGRRSPSSEAGAPRPPCGARRSPSGGGGGGAVASSHSISSCFEPVDGPGPPFVGDGHAQLGVADDDPGEGEPLDLVPVVERQAHRLAQRLDGRGQGLGVGELLAGPGRPSAGCGRPSAPRRPRRGRGRSRRRGRRRRRRSRSSSRPSSPSGSAPFGLDRRVRAARSRPVSRSSPAGRHRPRPGLGRASPKAARPVGTQSR